MSRKKTSRKSYALPAVCFSAAALGTFYYFIPAFKRPLQMLLGLIIGLSLILALTIRNNILRSVFVVFISVAACLLTLERLQKHYDLTSIFSFRSAPPAAPAAPESAAAGAPARKAAGYPWRLRDPASYLAARELAIQSGDYPDEPRHVGNAIFSGMDESGLLVNVLQGNGHSMTVTSVKPKTISQLPLGYELHPDNLGRRVGVELQTGSILMDGAFSIDAFGTRITRGNPSGDIYLFFGCSFTFGYGLDDDQTIPHFFSEAAGFDKRVLNLGVSASGPNSALRDMELDYRTGRAGVDPARVKGVVYTLIDSHPLRVTRPDHRLSPYYEVENGRAVYKGTLRNISGFMTRINIMMERSHLYPIIRQKLLLRSLEADPETEWRTTLAILAEMDRIARERYNVGLTVVYYGQMPMVPKRLEDMGIRVILADAAFEPNWREKSVKYMFFDEHPTAYANRLLGRLLWNKMKGEG